MRFPYLSLGIESPKYLTRCAVNSGLALPYSSMKCLFVNEGSERIIVFGFDFLFPRGIIKVLKWAMNKQRFPLCYYIKTFWEMR